LWPLGPARLTQAVDLAQKNAAAVPFTPFHFGPGAALKAAMQSRFSLTVFCYSQVVIDLETGCYLLRGEYPVHRFFHTYVGATLVGLVCALTGRPICQFALRALGGSVTIPWSLAFTSALIGTYSHVFLDSIMHPDVAPFRPFTAVNPTLDLVSVPLLHLLCVVLGVVGVLGYVILRRDDRA
jgi:hypothetical protein